MMAGKDSQSPKPLAPAASGTADSRSDTKELRRKKRIKYLLYFVAFVIIQTAVIAIFVLTIMKVRTPKFRVRSATFDLLNTDAAGAGRGSGPSFDWKMQAQLDVKNPNFGKFKYEDTTMYLIYEGAQIGEVNIPKSSVGWRSTKKLNVVADLSSANVPPNSQLGAALSLGLLRITSSAEMRGKVRLTFIFNKKKSAKMDCAMDISIPTKQLVNISCE